MLPLVPILSEVMHSSNFSLTGWDLCVIHDIVCTCNIIVIQNLTIILSHPHPSPHTPPHSAPRHAPRPACPARLRRWSGRISDSARCRGLPRPACCVRTASCCRGIPRPAAAATRCWGLPRPACCVRTASCCRRLPRTAATRCRWLPGATSRCRRLPRTASSC